MTTVPRIGRMLDLGGFLLFLGGGAMFVWSWIGFQGVPERETPVGGPAWAAIAVADRYWRLQKIGTGLMIAGVVVFVLAWWVARTSARRASVPAPTPE